MSGDVISDEELRRWEPLCRSIVQLYFAPGLEQQDLVQEARIAAFHALRGFDGDRGDLEAFVPMVIRRRVISAVIAANREKQRVLNTSVRARVNEDGEEVSVVELLVAKHHDPQEALEARQELAELAGALRERLSDLECACVVDLLAGFNYLEIEERRGLTSRQIDRGLQRARWKLRGAGPPSNPQAGHLTRQGEHGYRCPSCGGPTTKKPGPGRPPRCVVCRVRARKRVDTTSQRQAA